jgi:A/G-specific adenine glycosylase
VMLQQTQVSTVIPYWERFLKRFPTVKALAKATEDDVFGLWRGLGYYSRARNLHAAAKQIVAEHGGQLPNTAEALQTLPGFGRYTAGAVASIAFGEPAALVDGNVARVFSRWFVIEGAPGDPAREKLLWARAETLVPGERPGDFNQALMELGALICRSEQPTCLLCPVREGCGALREGRVGELPPPRVRAARKKLRLIAAVWNKADAILLGKRKSKGLFGGLWELPNVEAVPGEAPEISLQRLCGQRVQVDQALGTVARTLTHRDLEIELYQGTSRAKPSKNHPLYERLEFVDPQGIDTLGISSAMQKAIESVRPKLRG